MSAHGEVYQITKEKILFTMSSYGEVYQKKCYLL